MPVLNRTTRTQRTPPRRVLAPTRELFQYHRVDDTPEKLTSVTVRATHHADSPIQQNIFGNFIEHLGDEIYPGLWADVVINPNLESIDSNDRSPQGWQLEGATWAEVGHLSPRCVRLPAGEEAPSRLEQRVFLPAHRELSYRITCWVRAAADRGVLEIGIFGAGARAAEKLVSWQTDAATDQWMRAEAQFILRKGALGRGEPARLVVSHASGGAVDIDQIEIFPMDAVRGADTDVVKRARQWHIPLLRWPGGNFVSGYDWHDGIGPRDARPTRPNPAWGGVEPNSFGTDEALRFIREVGAQPQISINAGNGSAESAAEWVRYVNGPVTDPWGAKRAANGHRAPYDVRIWEVGNELYGGWQIGHASSEQYADRYARFRDAMLAADPHLRLIANGKADEFVGDGYARDQEWNLRLLKAATANGKPAPDWISMHPLVPLPGGLGGFGYAEQYESAMAHPTWMDRTLFPETARVIQETLGKGAYTRLAVTEWGIIIGGNRWLESPNHNSLAGAIYNALALNAMLRNSDWVTLANMTAFMHGGGIKKPAGVVTVDPQYWTQQLYAAAEPSAPVETATTGPGRDVPQRGFLPGVKDVPDVDCFSAISRSGGALVVFAVNRCLDESRPFSLKVEGFASRSVSASLLTGAEPGVRNTLENPDAVRPAQFQLPEGFLNGGSVTLPPHSLVVFTLKR